MATDDEKHPGGATPGAPARSAAPLSQAPSSQAPSSQAPSSQAPSDLPPVDRQVRAYRTPRYSVFLVTGAVLGLALGVAVALLGGSDTPAGGATDAGVLGYFAAFGTLAGALVAGTLAVVVESVVNRGRRGRARPDRRRPRGGNPPR